MNDLLQGVCPDLDDHRIRRYVNFDLPTFDALQEAKRRLSRLHRQDLSNAAVLRVMLLSHPWLVEQRDIPSSHPWATEQKAAR